MLCVYVFVCGCVGGCVRTYVYVFVCGCVGGCVRTYVRVYVCRQRRSRYAYLSLCVCMFFVLIAHNYPPHAIIYAVCTVCTILIMKLCIV